MPDLDHLRAEANDLYARARQIEDQDARLIVISRALELEMAAEAQVIKHQVIRNRRGGDRDSV